MRRAARRPRRQRAVATLAVAGAASLSLLAGAVPDALATTSPALDASALYQKVEPQRASKSRFAGTEAEALKNKKLGKASAPAPKAAASTAGSTAKTSKKAAKKAAKKKDNGGSAGALAAVVALAGVFVANASCGKGGGSSSGSAASKPAAAAGGDTPAARAASAQAWIDASDFGKSGGAAADTPEGRAADAQKWIDEWKKGQ